VAVRGARGKARGKPRFPCRLRLAGPSLRRGGRRRNHLEPHWIDRAPQCICNHEHTRDAVHPAPSRVAAKSANWATVVGKRTRIPAARRTEARLRCAPSLRRETKQSASRQDVAPRLQIGTARSPSARGCPSHAVLWLALNIGTKRDGRIGRDEPRRATAEGWIRTLPK
jgi:hypothetical protein